jgi:hypothetical protein
MIVLSVTPLAWTLMGRPAESYPELFFFLFGAPWALCLTMASVFIAIRGRAILSWRPFAVATAGCLLFPAWTFVNVVYGLSRLRLPNTVSWIARGEIVATGLVLAGLTATGLYAVVKKPS